MKVQTKFSPIIITFETEEEVKNFISGIDKIDAHYCHANPLEKLTKDEYKIIRDISNEFTKIIGI